MAVLRRQLAFGLRTLVRLGECLQKGVLRSHASVRGGLGAAQCQPTADTTRYGQRDDTQDREPALSSPAAPRLGRTGAATAGPSVHAALVGAFWLVGYGLRRFAGAGGIGGLPAGSDG